MKYTGSNENKQKKNKFTKLMIWKIWKATKNVEIGVVWRVSVTQDHQQHNHSIERIRLPIRL